MHTARTAYAREERRPLVLVHPPQATLLEGFSSGLIALANYTARSRAAASVKVLDLGRAADNQLAAEIGSVLQRLPSPPFVGITSTTATYQSALKTAAAFKALSPDCVTILGGHHASAQDEIIVKQHFGVVDYVIRGEGEFALVELIRRHPDVSTVPSLTYLLGLQPHRNTSAEHLGLLLDEQALDEIEPTFRGWGLRSAPGKFDHTTYVSARGCPLRCAFCSVANQSIRSKSVPAVIRDLQTLVGELGYTNIAIEDNFFAQSPGRTIALCQAIERLQDKLPFRWDCQTRVESCLKTDVMEAMERAGCEAVYLGVEAFDPEHLIYLKKTRHPGDYLRDLREKVVPWLVESRIDCYINLQLGIPGESQAHRQNALNQLKVLGRMADRQGKQITIFPQLHVVYPGTLHANQGIAEGRFGPDALDIFERFTAWEARQQPVLKWLGAHFAHGTGGIPEFILRPDLLGKGDFEVNGDAVVEIVNCLDDMERVPGIRIFKYGKYLTKMAEDTTVTETEINV